MVGSSPPRCMTPIWWQRIATCYLHLLLLSFTANHASLAITYFFNIAFSSTCPFARKPLKASTIRAWEPHLCCNAPIPLTILTICIDFVLVSTNVSKFFRTKFWTSNASYNSRSLTFASSINFWWFLTCTICTNKSTLHSSLHFRREKKDVSTLEDSSLKIKSIFCHFQFLALSWNPQFLAPLHLVKHLCALGLSTQPLTAMALHCPLIPHPFLPHPLSQF